MAENPRNVLLTGASTGIGHAAVLRLAHRGWRVFAGVRSQKAADELAALHQNIKPLIIDITDEKLVAAAKKTIDDACGPEGLQALVNNAGIGVAGPLEYQPISEVRRVLETNVIGHIIVTQAFMPAIRRGKGRVIFVGSGAGFVALPFFAAYASSKFALEAITDSFRRDLRPWKIPVINVEPGTVKTPILEKGFRDTEKMFADLPPEGRELYHDSYQILLKVLEYELRVALKPEAVALAIQSAVESPRPRHRYPVGSEGWLARMLRLMPSPMVDFMIATWHKQIAAKG